MVLPFGCDSLNLHFEKEYIRMLKRLILPSAICAILMSACNSSSSEEEIEYELSSDVAVTSFQLLDNSKVLDSLTNVYFSIDLLNARVYNADSLPYGTPVSRLQVLVKTNNASNVTIAFPRPGLADSVVNYTESSTDSIDFSNGPVKVTVTSQSGAVTRDYEVKVNVHKVKPDTLAWKQLQGFSLPSSISSVKSQFAARKGDTFYCLSASPSGQYCMVATTDPNESEWQVSTVSFPFTPVVTSLRATGNALFILASDNSLYTSADGSSWTDTGVDMTYLYGPYADRIIGTDGSSIIEYPSGKTLPMPSGFPVKDTSLPAVYGSDMALAQQIVLLGGVTADGNLSRDAWGYDGSDWARLSFNSNLNEGLQGPTLVAYDLFDLPSSTWSPVQYPALVAFGGKKADGSISRMVYISKDWGMNWKVAPELMALPEDLPALYCQPAFVYAITMHARSSAWTDLGVRDIYPFTSFVENRLTSKATAPITQWECPGIYIFGGMDAAGNTDPTLWRARISRYTFKPVQ